MLLRRIGTTLSLAGSLAHSYVQMLYGAWRLLALPEPVVTIFGGARFLATDPYMQQAHTLGHMLVEHNISVITGGGPGIMQAASCGVYEQKKMAKSLGIGVKNLGEGRNPCVDIYIEVDYLFSRKWLMTFHSTAFIIFPGGFGTIDELGETLILMSLKSIKRVPIVLVGKEYWNSFIDWEIKGFLQRGLIVDEDVKLVTVSDDLHEIIRIVHTTSQHELEKK